MFAIAFDLVVAAAAEHHPRGVTAAYTDIGTTLKKFNFERIQGSVYVCDNNAWRISSPRCWRSKRCRGSRRVRDIRGFRIENWSDFTPIIKEPPSS